MTLILEVNCGDGMCDWVGTLSEYDHHKFVDCEFELVDCPYFSVACGETCSGRVARKDLSAHTADGGNKDCMIRGLEAQKAKLTKLITEQNATIDRLTPAAVTLESDEEDEDEDTVDTFDGSQTVDDVSDAVSMTTAAPNGIPPNHPRVLVVRLDNLGAIREEQPEQPWELGYVPAPRRSRSRSVSFLDDYQRHVRQRAAVEVVDNNSVVDEDGHAQNAE
jgi:hypothetical protein